MRGGDAGPSVIFRAALEANTPESVAPCTRAVTLGPGMAVPVTLAQGMWMILDERAAAEGISSDALCARAFTRFPAVELGEAVAAYLVVIVCSSHGPMPPAPQSPAVSGVAMAYPSRPAEV